MKRNKGVSMITLIITIIVIIILAAIAFVGMDDATGSAQYAKFSSEFGDYATNFTGGAVTKVQESLGLAGKVANKAQIVYCAARGVNLSEFDEVLNGVVTPSGYTSSRFQTDIKDATGATYVLATADTPCYEIKDDVMKEYKGKSFYGNANGQETHWVTATGKVFTLPGYPRTVDGEERMYISADLYYVPKDGEMILASKLIAKTIPKIGDETSGATVGNQKVADAADHANPSGTPGGEESGSGEETKQGELLAEAIKSGKIQVGDYVNYPVEYENLTVYEKTSIYEGWRVLSVEDDGTVNLVSAGIPLTYHHVNEYPSKSVEALTTNFLTTQITDSGIGYREMGFEPYLTLMEVFTNKYTKVAEDGTTLVVRAMTKEDMDAVYGITRYGEYLKAGKYNGLFSIGSFYWLASSGNGMFLWNVYSNGFVANSSKDGAENGIRPVVSLKPEVRVTTQDESGAWNIEI